MKRKLNAFFLACTFLSSAVIIAQTEKAQEPQTLSENKTQEKVITGIVTQVQAKFLGAQALTVGKTELVLLANQNDASLSTFQVNKEFNDFLVKTNEGFELNKKYKDKVFSFVYSVNGKGWNCISKINHVPASKKSTKIKASKKSNTSSHENKSTH
ncbi:MAG: hypothetical protein JST67_07310 [Bacteroidetes bacterium]|nr:hypothetical protein [Bacteroidota bacterium]